MLNMVQTLSSRMEKERIFQMISLILVLSLVQLTTGAGNDIILDLLNQKIILINDFFVYML